MSEVTGTLAGRAAALRRDFDRAFAEPHRPAGAATQDFLAIRIGAEPCALRLAEIASLQADKKITALPESDAALLGIAGFRGAILPVYSLPGLLGRPSPEAPRWLVVASAVPVALAFDHFDGHLRVTPDAVLPQRAGEARFHAREHVRAGGLMRPVIDLTAVLAAITTRRPETAPEEER